VALGQVITMASLPLVTRTYETSAVGAYSLFSTTAFLLGTIVSLRYELAISLAANRKMAASAFALCVYLMLATSSACGGAFFIFRGQISSWFGEPELANLVVWLPVQTLTIGIFMVSSQWATRREIYGPQVGYQISRAVAVSAIQLLCAYLWPTAGGLVLGQCAGFGLAGLWLMYRATRGDRAELARAFATKRVKTAARKFSNLPKFSAPQEIITGIGQSLPNFVIGLMFGPHVVAVYWIAKRTMQLPINFVSQAIRQVYLRHLSQRLSKNLGIQKDVIWATAILAVSGTVFFVPAFLFSPYVFGVLFGAEWAEAGEYAKWISIWMFSALAKVPSWCVFHALNSQRSQFAFEAASFFTQNGLLLCLALYSGPLAGMAGYSLSGCLINILFIIRAILISKHVDRPAGDDEDRVLAQ
jgi:O-antigen/teichoic acid export membrane protein